MTKKRLLALGLLVAFLNSSAWGQLTLDGLASFATRFPFAVIIPGEKEAKSRFMYADVLQHVHLYRIEKGKLVLEWESTNLGSRVTSLFAQDLYGDGGIEIVVTTEGGRILIYDGQEYDLIWENLQDPFEKIECMCASNIDSDPQAEFIFVANSHLYIYDSKNKNLEWQSQKELHAQEIVVANVDDDEQVEIILNTGTILDSRFYNIEFESDTPFGERISLLDINGDGVPEIFGEFGNFSLRIYDIYAEREIW